MLIHSYLTSGFLEMAKLFLKSLYAVMGTAAPLVQLDTRSLSDEHIRQLRECYDNDRLHIVNQPIPIANWAERAGVSVGQLKKYKRQCEHRYVSHKNRVWKLMTAGDDRVQALQDVLWPINPQAGPEWGSMPDFVAHFDIDTLFRAPLEGLPAMMDEANIWLKLRTGHPTIKARITIDCIFVRATNDVRDFFNRWRYYINRVPAPERPVGFGQSSCWQAFSEMSGRLKYAQLPLKYGLPGRNHPDDVIWTGNVHKLAKDDCIKLFKADMRNHLRS